MNNQPFDPSQPINPYQGAQPPQNPYMQVPAMDHSGELSIRDAIEYGYRATFGAFWIWLAISLLETAAFRVTFTIQELYRSKNMPVEQMINLDEMPLLELFGLYFSPQNIAMSFFFNFLLCTLFVPLFLVIALVQIDGLKLRWANIQHRLAGSRGFAATALLWLIIQIPVGILLIFFLDFPYHDPVTNTVVGSLSHSIFVMLMSMVCSMILTFPFLFTVHRVLDSNTTLYGAFRDSFLLIAQHPFKVMAGIFSLQAINLLLVMFTCGFGLLLVLPVLANSSTHLYRQLIHKRSTQIEP